MKKNRQLLEVLKRLGIDSHVLGYNYLYEMIHVYQSHDKLIAEKVSYPVLIMKFKKSKPQIDRSLQYSFYLMNKNMTPLYQQLFNEAPEIDDFMKTISYYLTKKV